MHDPTPGVFLWASILGFKSLALVVTIVTAMMGPSLWNGRKWWVWILPRHWQHLISSQTNEDFRRFWWKVRIFCWVVFIALAGSWIALAYQVMNRH